MDQVHAVELGYGEQKVAEKLARVVFAQRTLLVDKLPQVSVGAVLHDLKHAVAVQYRLVQANDMVVSESFHGQRLADDLLVEHHVAAGASAERLHGNVHARSEVIGELDFGKFSIADGRTKEIRRWDEEVETVVSAMQRESVVRCCHEGGARCACASEQTLPR